MPPILNTWNENQINEQKQNHKHREQKKNIQTNKQKEPKKNKQTHEQNKDQAFEFE
jgi:hypothetical protein